MSYIQDLLKIKAEIHKRSLRFKRLKSDKGIEKNRDAITTLRRDFANIVYDNYEKLSLRIEKITDKDKNAFCVMSMTGGPCFLSEKSCLHVYKAGFGHVQVIICCHVGVLNLLDDKCGVDNLKRLANG